VKRGPVDVVGESSLEEGGEVGFEVSLWWWVVWMLRAVVDGWEDGWGWRSLEACGTEARW